MRRGLSGFGNERLALTLVLMGMGAGWGLSQPLTKIAVSTGHPAIGLVFWQFTLASLILGAVNLLRRRSLPLGRPAVALYVFIALTGSLLPGLASYNAAVHLPSGVMSIVISAVPMLAFPIALALGVDRFSGRRLAGLLLGLGGVALIALPETSLPDRAALVWLPVALIAPLFYAIEANGVARLGTGGIDSISVLFGASLSGVALSLPLAVASDALFLPPWPLGRPELALVLSSSVNAFVYATYVWIVGRAGAVFAGQVSYLVTGFGVLWAMTLLGETYSLWVWSALALMLAGLTLVAPRKAEVAV